MFEMLNIFICEDDKMQLQHLREFVYDAIIIADYDMEITLATTNPNDIIEYIKNNKVHGLYFLDVKLDAGINGFELAEYIREYDQRAFIVFITGKEKNYRLSLDYLCEPLDYIIKDYNTEGKTEMKRRISRSLKIAQDRSLVTNKNEALEKGLVLLRFERYKNTMVDMNDIVWIKKNKDNPNKVDIKGCNSVKQVIGTLKEVLEQLDDRFIQVGKFYIINKDRIKDYDISHKLITLKGDADDSIATTLQVSPQAMKKFLKEIYPDRNESIKNKDKNIELKLFEKKSEEEPLL